MNNRLTITGVEFDTILETTAMWVRTIVGNAAANRMHKSRWISEFIARARDLAMTLSYCDFEEWYDCFWRTLCGNFSSRTCPAPDYWQHAFEAFSNYHLSSDAKPIGNAEESKMFEQKMQENRDKIRDVLSDPRSESAVFHRYMTQFADSVLDNQFCVTERQHMGLVNDYAQPGDRLCILFGGHVPFVLRPNRPDDLSCREFYIVGEAYVHGGMNGEVLDNPNFEIKEFIIL